MLHIRTSPPPEEGRPSSPSLSLSVCAQLSLTPVAVGGRGGSSLALSSSSVRVYIRLRRAARRTRTRQETAARRHGGRYQSRQQTCKQFSQQLSALYNTGYRAACPVHTRISRNDTHIKPPSLASIQLLCEFTPLRLSHQPVFHLASEILSPASWPFLAAIACY